VTSEQWTATHVADTKTLTRVGNGGVYSKDVKYEGRSGNVYENKGSADTMTDNYSGFCALSAPFLQKLTKIQRAFWPKIHKSDDKCGEAGTPIRSSVHRPIDPPAQHGEDLKWPDVPMTPWPDHLAFPLCTSKQRRLARSSKNPAKRYIIEIKTVTSFVMAGERKNAGGKYEGIFHYVIENKWWKNVRKRPFLYVIEK
jgi:hypothetical protein